MNMILKNCAVGGRLAASPQLGRPVAEADAAKFLPQGFMIIDRCDLTQEAKEHKSLYARCR